MRMLVAIRVIPFLHLLFMLSIIIVGQRKGFLHIDAFTGKVALMRRFISLALIAALLMLSGAPLVSATIHGDGMTGMSCPVCYMNMDSINHKKMNHLQMSHTQQSKGMRHCHIECCNHQDVGSLPHQLAPHAPVLSSVELTPVMTGAIDLTLPVFQPRLFSLLFPPPRFS